MTHTFLQMLKYIKSSLQMKTDDKIAEYSQVASSTQ